MKVTKSKRDCGIAGVTEIVKVEPTNAVNVTVLWNSRDSDVRISIRGKTPDDGLTLDMDGDEGTIYRYGDTNPSVNPESDSLEDLFLWGAAHAKAKGLTPEKSREILQRVRKGLEEYEEGKTIEGLE